MRSVLASFGYTAIGEQVGMAQRMESVASPGGVMLRRPPRDWSMAQRRSVSLRWFRSRAPMKPVAAQRLLGMEERHRLIERARVESGRTAVGDVRR